MARLTIPQRNRAGLSKFLVLPKEAFDDFIGALTNERAALDLPLRVPDKMKVSGLTKSDLDDVMRAIVSLSILQWSRESESGDQKTFINEIAEAIEVFDPIGASDESKERLRRTLSLDTLLITSKAISIFTDYQRTLYSSKILTDLRYVFQEDPEDEPYGAVIVHLLKLSYHEDTQHKEFFVAMDDNDLAQLKRLVERADKKARNIRRRLDASKTVYLGAEKGQV